MEISQLLLSLLHGWSLDGDLDHVCRDRLGLSTPKTRICFGLLSRSGMISAKMYWKKKFHLIVMTFFFQ
jgi:hypothetical protein